ncbi:hypothetical protein [Mycobacterium antarcticum]|uniref:hypothetical protein n=2 Tax=unclassified Mycolicibacterium TaxID=2636767 RepID=UPI0024E0A1B7|nr:hypothetical protein [Mycolicibacterium sp. TUM20983]
MFDTDDTATSPPLVLDLLGVDMEHTTDASGRDIVTMTLFDAAGIRIACPMDRLKAKAFGLSLAEYA